jgi:hypothetical protein
MVMIDELAPGLRLGPLTIPDVDERAGRSALRDQIARLERELANAVISAFPRTCVDIRVPGLEGPRLLDLGALERIRDDLADRLSAIRRVLDERGAEEESNRVLLERMLLEPGRYKFAKVTNAELGECGCLAWQVRPRLGLIGMLMGWWHVKLSSGCPLPRG